MKKISIIIGTYNQAEYLPICLDSVWFQDWPDLEIVIVNDASTDRTSAVLEAYELAVVSDRVSYACNYNETTDRVERFEHLRYPPDGRELKIIHHSENKGLGAALNTGFKAATGEYCTFIASDDLFLPSAMSELMAALEVNQADFSYADMHIVDDSGRILRRFCLPDYSFEESFCKWYMLGICKLYRRSLHDEVGWYDETIKPQDHDMFLRFAMHGARFVHVPKVLAHVRDHNNGRQVDNHHPSNWNRLYAESSRLALQARAFAESSKHGDAPT